MSTGFVASFDGVPIKFGVAGEGSPALVLVHGWSCDRTYWAEFRHAREMPDLIDELDVPIATINPDDAPTDLDSMSKFEVDVIIMPGVGHFPMMEDPERFNDLLLATIDELLKAQ